MPGALSMNQVEADKPDVTMSARAIPTILSSRFTPVSPLPRAPQYG
jgi:hypothetical protein